MKKDIKKVISKIHHKLLKDDSFTIISNNCWGGVIYKYFGMKFQTPTVGMYFFPDEYLKFCANLNYYLSLDLYVTNVEKSIYKDILVKKGQPNVLIGHLEDVEIVLLHYHDPVEAICKWNYRKNRIHYDKLIIKFNDQNGCRDDHIMDFYKLPFKNKICFSAKNVANCSELIVFREFKKQGYVVNDTKVRYWRRHLNIIKYINSI